MVTNRERTLHASQQVSLAPRGYSRGSCSRWGQRGRSLFNVSRVYPNGIRNRMETCLTLRGHALWGVEPASVPPIRLCEYRFLSHQGLLRGRSSLKLSRNTCQGLPNRMHITLTRCAQCIEGWGGGRRCSGLTLPW